MLINRQFIRDIIERVFHESMETRFTEEEEIEEYVDEQTDKILREIVQW